MPATPPTPAQHTHPLLNKLGTLRGGAITVRGIYSAQLGEPDSDLACVITVQDPQALQLALKNGVLGFCEAYLEGAWDVDDLVVLVRIMARNRFLLDRINSGFASRMSQLFFRLMYWRQRNNRAGSARNIAAHYDLSNDFFKLFLDSKMMYSSAIYRRAEQQLEEAATHKLKVICEKLQLKASDHLLEIGTGWGGLAIYAAQHYGCTVTTTTLSQAQYDEAQARISDTQLEDKINLLKTDYRDLDGRFDKLVSVEMIEAVGHQYLDTYFKHCQNYLKPDGLALIQAITIEDTRYTQALKTVDFIKHYIFPGSFIPCNRVMIDSAAKQGLKLIHLEDIGASYARTIAAWRENFHAQREAVLNQGFDQRFIRMWDFYLCYCQGGFSEGVISDVHLLFSNTMRPV